MKTRELIALARRHDAALRTGALDGPRHTGPAPRGSSATLGLLLAVQATSQSGQAVIVILSALTAAELSGSIKLATLPIALQFLATMIAAVPVSLQMSRMGRRAALMAGQVTGVLGALVAAAGIFSSSFWVFTSASLLFGVHNAAWQHLRYAAAETVPDDKRARAISLVVLGGLVAAVLGPFLALHAQGIVPGNIYAGGYLVIAALCALNLGLLALPRLEGAAPARARLSVFRTARLVTDRRFLNGALASGAGAGTMIALMTATPLAMAHAAYGMKDTTLVIQWHIVAMYLPSFFTGRLIQHVGLRPVLAAGLALDLLAIAINLAGASLAQFWLGLFAVGLGWNFLFIGGTSLISSFGRPRLRGAVQALNELVIFTVSAGASFMSGCLFSSQGWFFLNICPIPPLALVGVAILRYRPETARRS